MGSLASEGCRGLSGEIAGSLAVSPATGLEKGCRGGKERLCTAGVPGNCSLLPRGSVSWPELVQKNGLSFPRQKKIPQHLKRMRLLLQRPFIYQTHLLPVWRLSCHEVQFPFLVLTVRLWDRLVQGRVKAQLGNSSRGREVAEPLQTGNSQRLLYNC